MPQTVRRIAATGSRLVGPKRTFRKVRVGRSTLHRLTRPPTYVAAYYDYCASGLQDALVSGRSPAEMWLAFPGQLNVVRDPSSAALLQIEHTLVAPGGRDSVGAESGSVPLIGGDTGRYTVRLTHREEFEAAGAVIDYSMPNIQNISNSRLEPVYRGKASYIAPLLTSAEKLRGLREDVGVITMHGEPSTGRRGALREDLANRGVPARNLENVWRSYEEHFDAAAILLNIHQTEHHHTLEELRVLPALLRQVVVVCEASPLLDRVPYGDLLVVAPYEDLARTVQDVVDNYQEVWHAKFGNSHLQDLYQDLRHRNSRAFARVATTLGAIRD